MKSSILKGILLALALGWGLEASKPAMAAVVTHSLTSNAVDKCQAFTPGLSNTIRNRVRGAENIGAKPIAVVCSFELDEVTLGDDSQFANVSLVELTFDNPGKVQVEVVCTLLPGKTLNFGAQVERRTLLAPGSQGAFLQFDAIGPNVAVGVNCIIPPKVVIAHTRIRYDLDGG